MSIIYAPHEDIWSTCEKHLSSQQHECIWNSIVLTGAGMGSVPTLTSYTSYKQKRLMSVTTVFKLSKVIHLDHAIATREKVFQ